MAYASWHTTVTDLQGNVIPNASIYVVDEATGIAPQLYADRQGLVPVGNPLTAEADGTVNFYVIGGAYRIQASSGAWDRTWRYVGIGTAQEFDVDQIIGNSVVSVNPQTFTPVEQEQARENIGAVHSVRASALITVGSGGDFGTVNEALAFASRMRPEHVVGGISVEIRLLSGFTMAEQVFLSGVDLGFVRLTSVDAVVPVNEAAITEAFAPLDALVPIMGGKDGAVLPLINVLFEYSSNTTAKDGIAVTNGAKVVFAPSATDSNVPVSGVRNSRRGLNILYGAEAICEMPGSTQGGGGGGAGVSVGVDFSGTLYRALQVQHGGRATLLRSNFSNCAGDNAVYVIWNSQADIWQSNITGHTGSNAAVHSRDGSVVCARECDVSGAANRGFHALHAAVLDARSGIANNCGTYGFIANGAAFIDATNGQADDAGNSGVWASNGSIIEFENGSAQRAGGTAGVGGTAACNISANGANVSGNTSGRGFSAASGTQLSADGATANNCSIGLFALASNIAAENVTANNCGIGLVANRGALANVRGGSFQNASNYGVECIEASMVNAQQVNCTGASTFGLRVGRGGTINANGSTGTTSKTANQIDANGVIYQ